MPKTEVRVYSEVRNHRAARGRAAEVAAENGWIRRKYKTHSWKGTMMAVNTVGHLAEAAWHHPDLTVSYAWFEVRLTTHDAKGITDKDFELAKKIEEVIELAPAPMARSKAPRRATRGSRISNTTERSLGDDALELLHQFRRALRTAARPSSISSAARWNSNRPIVLGFMHDHMVGRIAGQARAHDAVLRDVERVDHHRGDARRALGLWSAAPRRSHQNRPGGGWRRRGAAPRPRSSAASCTRGSARHVAADGERQHPFGAERARDVDRHGIDDRAVEQPAPADLHRLENAGQRVGGAHRVDDRAVLQPHLVAGPHLRRDGRQNGSADSRCAAAPSPIRAGRAAGRRPSGRRRETTRRRG